MKIIKYLSFILYNRILTSIHCMYIHIELNRQFKSRKIEISKMFYLFKCKSYEKKHHQNYLYYFCLFGKNTTPTPCNLKWLNVKC
jgi:hypothetical protein